MSKDEEVKTVDGKGQTKKSKTLVLKIGSSSLSTADGRFLNLSTITHLVETIVELRKEGHRVILVTSGAVAVGCQRMRLPERPKELVTKQAVAAIGQSRLMRVYDDLFSHLDTVIAQVLLSRENLGKRHHYKNALNTFNELLRLNVVPIVNENDTVAVEELRFGDNDTLSALVASLVEADYLFLLTDVDALYTADPNKHKDAKPIRVVEHVDKLTGVNADAGGSSWGTGGMFTKLQAARLATAAGVRTVITRSTKPENIAKILAGEDGIGTHFLAQERPIKGKKKWIAQGIQPNGAIALDIGASQAVLNKSSLFAAGITGVKGGFQAQSNVRLLDPTGKEIARGLTNYSSEEIDKIKGKKSKDVRKILGFNCDEEVIHRENLVVLSMASR